MVVATSRDVDYLDDLLHERHARSISDHASAYSAYMKLWSSPQEASPTSTPCHHFSMNSTHVTGLTSGNALLSVSGTSPQLSANAILTWF